jgi:hypothetical protein
MRLTLVLVAILAIVCSAPSEPAAALTPPIPPMDGTYRVQPGGVVVACGGITGTCRTLQLEGTIDLDASFTEVRIASTDLRLVDGGASPFPVPGELQLAGLEGVIQNEGESPFVELQAEGQFGQRVALELRTVGVVPNLVGNLLLALRGTYDEGCCDRWVYDFGNVRLEPDFLEALELGGGDYPRFEIAVYWGDGFSESVAVPAELGSNLGYFWFFSQENPEIFVKIIDACDTDFESVWFFASGLTNLKVRIEVRDRHTFQNKTYHSHGGSAFMPIQDTAGFPCVSLP